MHNAFGITNVLLVRRIKSQFFGVAQGDVVSKRLMHGSQYALDNTNLELKVGE